MSMIPAFLTRLIAVAAISLCFANCGRAERYWDKIMLAAKTPDGGKKTSSVVEVRFWPVSIPARGIMARLDGQDVYLDLGVGRRPVVALVTTQLHAKHG